jgi:CubicO group peptidase (beta-lactamase class C family)
LNVLDVTGNSMVEFPHAIGRRLEALLKELTSRTPIKQTIMAVEMGERFRWDGAFGESADATPLRADAPFFIASIDKLVNATIAMKLSEQGRLDINASISAYLPRNLTRGLHRLNEVDYSERVSVRHLLGHTSGLADWLEDRPKGGQSLVDRVIRDGDMALSIDDVATIVRDHLKPYFPPQDLSATRPRIRYSDTNFMLLCAVIEAPCIQCQRCWGTRARRAVGCFTVRNGMCCWSEA